MRWQKNMSQKKEQGKNVQDQINEEEIGNLPEKEFRVMIVKMMQNLRNRMEAWIEKIQEMFMKDLEELKNKKTEMNNTHALKLLSSLEILRFYLKFHKFTISILKCFQNYQPFTA